MNAVLYGGGTTVRAEVAAHHFPALGAEAILQAIVGGRRCLLLVLLAQLLGNLRANGDFGTQAGYTAALFHTICRRHGILTVLDASLLQDNLYFIKTREAEMKDLSIREITRRIADQFLSLIHI